MASMSLPAPDRDACSYTACKDLTFTPTLQVSWTKHFTIQGPVALPSWSRHHKCNGITVTNLVYTTILFTDSKETDDTKNIHLKQRKKNIIMDNLLETLKGKIFQSSTLHLEGPNTHTLKVIALFLSINMYQILEQHNASSLMSLSSYYSSWTELCWRRRHCTSLECQ